MKTIGLVILLVVHSSCYLNAKIKNGYEPQLQTTKTSLQKLQSLIAEDLDMTKSQRLRVQEDLDMLIDYISCYELTEVLIERLKIVSPAIYMQIDSIKDKKGRYTDVYIKLITREKTKVPLKAASFFEQSPVDKDQNVSIYGNCSVAVDIWIADNALFLLCHELGHISYIVPNLAAYAQFYQRHYSKEGDVSYIGHRPSDLSGKAANMFEKRFIVDRSSFVKQNEKKPEAFVSMLIKTRKNIRNMGMTNTSSAVVSAKKWPRTD